jgi:hypothetical protein
MKLLELNRNVFDHVDWNHEKWKSIANTLPYVLLLAYFVLGTSLIYDYGITQDDFIQRKHGIVTFDNINAKFQIFPSVKPMSTEKLQEYNHRDYGTIFQLTAYILENLLNINHFRGAFMLRHFLTFTLFWLSAVFLFKTALLHFKKNLPAFMAVVFYVLSPRIFAEAFYNVKDIVMLSWMVIGIYTLLKFLDHKNWKYLLAHAFTCAMAVDTRIVGILLPFVTVVFLLFQILDSGIRHWIWYILPKLAVWAIATVLLIIVFWPILWENPVSNFLYSYNSMKRFRWSAFVLYRGDFVWSLELPWHYALVQILITTPIVYTFMFLVGFIVFIVRKALSRKIGYNTVEERNNYIFMAIFCLPLISVIWHKSVLYNGWRQLFFIYPAFVMISVQGMVWLFSVVKKKLQSNLKLAFTILLAGTIGFSCISTMVFLVKNHPYQYMYFNIFAGKSPLRNFDGDYYGLSFKHSLDFMLQTYPGDTLRIHSSFPNGVMTSLLYPEEEKARIRYTDLEEADFYITNHYHPAHPERYKDYWEMTYPFDQKKIFSLKMKGEDFTAIYKLKKK